MINIIITVVGAVAFAVSFYFNYKKQKANEDRKVLAVVTYVCLAVLMIGVIRMAFPVFNVFPKSVRNLAMVGMQLLAFILGAEFIVRPAFEKEEEEQQNTISRYGKNNKKNKKKNKR